MKLFSKKNWKTKGLEVINSHFGKKRTYETFLRIDPSVAEKYLRFISRNSNATYIQWDRSIQNFRY